MAEYRSAEPCASAGADQIRSVLPGRGSAQGRRGSGAANDVTPGAVRQQRWTAKTSPVRFGAIISRLVETLRDRFIALRRTLTHHDALMRIEVWEDQYDFHCQCART
jgi:hypothetical protein